MLGAQADVGKGLLVHATSWRRRRRRRWWFERRGCSSGSSTTTTTTRLGGSPPGEYDLLDVIVRVSGGEDVRKSRLECGGLEGG